MIRSTVSGSGDLSRLLERADRLATAAGRPDLVERLGVVRSWLAGRPVCVAVSAGAGSGSAMARSLARVSARTLPGASYVDAPGSSGAGRSVPPTAVDVVLFVTDARREYGRVELDALARLRAQYSQVVAVLTNYEACPDLATVQAVDRQRLQGAGLDDPAIPLLPVSTVMCDDAWLRNDDASLVASGVPQLVEYLRDHVDSGVDARLRDAALAEIRGVVEALLPGWSAELTRLQGEAAAPGGRQQAASAELDRRQRLSTAWQIALADGVTELGAQVDFDLRERLREVLESADEQVAKGNPFGDWPAFDRTVRDQVRAAVTTDYQVLRSRASGLATTVVAEMTGTPEGSPAGVALPRLRVQDPDDALRRLPAMPAPEGGGSLLSRIVNSVRGSYGGILMVGVLTSLAGQQLISVYSVAAGVLLGVFTFFEDRRSTLERRRAEGRVAVAKLLDAANFRIGDDQRTQLRAVQRTLRDHFTVVNDERLRQAAEAVRTAASDDGAVAARVVELESGLVELHELRTQLSTGHDGQGGRRLAAVRSP
ncbi:hypothetical protein [Actinomycetospora sp. TBRC 11914]|uniref:hypothetical protein n=1 Tax=Actinomycetospora sp. TBRC 11914 TaxID=2729387 RepID=UPI00145D198D|nr:hypothetical protein [Actinomycetospora sp. TBRC 11914]NMO91049.1 hypothetical protein [Actinomycetospora sp. TBRC 11914]